MLQPRRTQSLHRYVKQGSTAGVLQAIGAGVDINITDRDSRIPLHYVCYIGTDVNEMITLLVHHGSNIYAQDKYDNDPFGFALLHDRFDICRSMIRLGYSFQKSGSDVVDVLSSIPLDVPGAVDKLAFLKECDVDISTPISPTGDTLLHTAVQDHATFEVFNFLCESGLSVNARNSLQMTPLHCLKYNELQNSEMIISLGEIVTLFLKHGFDINSKDIHSCTFLHYAVWRMRNMEFIQLLVTSGADVSIRNATGIAPIHIATNRKDISVLQYFLDSGCPIDILDSYGASALHYAVWNNNPNALRFLLSHCGEPLPDQTDSQGKSPVEMAQYFGYTELIKIMRPRKNYANEHQEKAFDALDQREIHRNTQSGDTFQIREEKPVVYAVNADTMQSNALTQEEISDVLESPILGKLPMNDETRQIQQKVHILMECVAERVGSNVPILEFTPTLSGSVSEGTKCGFPDEFDYLCIMDEFTGCFLTPDISNSPPGFCQLNLKQEYASKNKDICNYINKNCHLDSDKVISDLHMEINAVLTERTIWENDLEGLTLRSRCEIGSNALTATLIWNGATYKDLYISVDMVPAIHLPDFWPNSDYEKPLVTHPDIPEGGTHVVMAVYEMGTERPGGNHNRLSFSRAETCIFRVLPADIKLGYILAKTIRNPHICPPITNTHPGKMLALLDSLKESKSDQMQLVYSRQGKIENDSEDCENTSDFDNKNSASVFYEYAEQNMSTYWLKNALFAQVERVKRGELCIREDGDMISKARMWASLIYRHILQCLIENNLSSYFVPRLNLLKKNYDSDQHFEIDFEEDDSDEDSDHNADDSDGDGDDDDDDDDDYDDDDANDSDSDGDGRDDHEHNVTESDVVITDEDNSKDAENDVKNNKNSTQNDRNGAENNRDDAENVDGSKENLKDNISGKELNTLEVEDESKNNEIPDQMDVKILFVKMLLDILSYDTKDIL